MGGGSIHVQNVADAYVSNNNNHASGAGVVMGGKTMKKNMNNSNFNQMKYISGNTSHNNS